MKKELVSFFALLVSISFAGASGFTDLLNSIDQTMILLLVAFIISFALIFFALNKIFKKENTAISGIIAVALSFLISYGLIKSGWDFQNSLYGIGISQELLGVVIPIILAAGIIFLIIKPKRHSLLVIGGLLILLSFFVYAKSIFMVGGIILGIIWGFIMWKFPKNQMTNPNSRGYREDTRG